MNNAPSADASVISHSMQKGSCSVTLVRVATLYARIALGAAFLSAVADRFGLFAQRVQFAQLLRALREPAPASAPSRKMLPRAPVPRPFTGCGWIRRLTGQTS